MLQEFIERLEDEICKRADIDSYEEVMKELAIELYKRYGDPLKGQDYATSTSGFFLG